MSMDANPDRTFTPDDIENIVTRSYNVRRSSRNEPIFSLQLHLLRRQTQARRGVAVGLSVDQATCLLKGLHQFFADLQSAP